MHDAPPHMYDDKHFGSPSQVIKFTTKALTIFIILALFIVATKGSSSADIFTVGTVLLALGTACYLDKKDKPNKEIL